MPSIIVPKKEDLKRVGGKCFSDDRNKSLISGNCGCGCSGGGSSACNCG